MGNFNSDILCDLLALIEQLRATTNRIAPVEGSSEVCVVRERLAGMHGALTQFELHVHGLAISDGVTVR